MYNRLLAINMILLYHKLDKMQGQSSKQMKGTCSS